ncbi:hypothetical protein EVAR_66895_1 [Eumeta japonica]|uniref:Uncharacterized protein n=1 Tax=Eumeta variegata TaxID=151549 RepID=A0A4C2AB66_EUMVA|nr:hypothetical protein EVAR_66895_1 [Eumeta japonica]
MRCLRRTPSRRRQGRSRATAPRRSSFSAQATPINFIYERHADAPFYYVNSVATFERLRASVVRSRRSTSGRRRRRRDSGSRRLSSISRNIV